MENKTNPPFNENTENESPLEQDLLVNQNIEPSETLSTAREDIVQPTYSFSNDYILSKAREDISSKQIMFIQNIDTLSTTRAIPIFEFSDGYIYRSRKPWNFDSYQECSSCQGKGGGCPDCR